MQQGTCQARGTGKGKNVTQEKIKAPGTKEDTIITQLGGYQRITKSGMPLDTFCLVQLEDTGQFTS